MPIYLYWGEDDFAISRAVAVLRDRTLDADWASFNFDKISPDQSDAIVQALNQVMTPPFGMGSRLVWLVETTLCQRCPDDVLSELERTLPVIPDTTVLLLTTSSKPDGRLKSTKLLQKHAEIREFSLIPPWKTDQLIQQVRQTAQDVGVKLTNTAVQMLAEAVGNDTRQLFSELEKLRLYGSNTKQALGEEAIATLVTTSTQSSLQLAGAIRQGDTARALTLIADLFRRNEPALKIIKTLVGQFRTWLWVKLMLESGERDEREIARAAEVSNPKRIYFLQQEVKPLSLTQLQQAIAILMDIEVGLKQGAEEIALFQTKLIVLCQLLQK
jgi:DNA polymerase III subunit delta